ncbi:MAG: hypothetical protein ABI706_11325 [Ilumatobacteraceae bacterium]
MSVMIDPLLAPQHERSDRTNSIEFNDHEPPLAPDSELDRFGRRRTRRWIGRITVGVTVVLLPPLYSYTSALTGPGSDSLQARTVEWARDNHLGPVVDRLENWYYSRHQAVVGGVPSVSVLPTAPRVDTPVVSGPAPLQTPAAVPIPGEGAWTPLGPLINGKADAFVTSIRPDNVHTSSIDEVVNFDPKFFSFRAYPGTKIPQPWDRPDYVELNRRPSLVAAFSGGFRLRDSGGGMILGGAVIQPMTNGIATMSIDKNGVPNIGMWGRDIVDSSSLDSARQNLDPIVDNGIANPDLLTDSNRKWGFTGPKNKTAVWRSGAGITADGHLIWVGGPGLTIEALAQTLVRAGAIRGMQLEINQEWVQLNTYSTNSSGKTTGKRLMSGMQHNGNRWLTEDTRDFVAAFVRSP